jgi:hypothetical protein
MADTASARQRASAASRPFLAREITLRSLQAQKTYERDFSVTSANLYTMLVMTRVKSRDDIADQAEVVVRQLLDEFREEIKAEMARVEHLIAANALEDTAIEYSRPKTLSVEITSPEAHQYLNLILLLDQLMYRLDVLHMTGVVEHRAKMQRTYEWQRKLAKVAGRLRNHANSLKRSMDEGPPTEQAAPVDEPAVRVLASEGDAYPGDALDDASPERIAASA